MLCQLGIGRLEAEAKGKSHLFMIDGGFAQMVDNKLTILTEQAREASEIDRDAARETLKDAMARKASSAAEYEERGKDIPRARAQLKVAS